MNTTRFDAIARSVNTLRSRRSLLGLAVGGVLGLANLRQGADATLAQARTKRKKRQRKQQKACPKARRCGKKCCRGKTRCQKGVCRKPKPAKKPQTPPTGGPPVRKNVHSLSTAELDAFARGVAVMKDRPENDPTSWAAQVKRHRDHAKHGNYHFLPWHRMFLYHFEQILRDAAGDQTLTLPYWSPNPDYSGASCVLPAPFRTEGNPLYRADRNSMVNDGVVPPAYYWFSTTGAMNVPQFVKTSGSAGFGGNAELGSGGGSLERGQHDNLHNWVGAGGGVMSQPSVSPQDPIFWLHHANIDRLWEAWLRQPGRANPTNDPVFMDTSFSFDDRNKQPVTMTAREVLDVVGQLTYRYDDQPVGGNPNAGKMTSQAMAAMNAAKAEPRSLAIATAPRQALGPNQVKVAVAVKPGSVARFRAVKQAKGPVRLTLKGVGANGVTGIYYEVHAGPIKPNPSAKHTSYVGSVNPFTVEVANHGGHGGHHGGGSTDFTFDITRAVASGGGVKRVMVTLVPVNMAGSGNTPAGPWLTVEQFVVEVNAGSVGAGTKGKKRKPARMQGSKPTPKQLRKRRQRTAARNRRLANQRRQQQRQRAAANQPAPHDSHTGTDGEALNVPGAKHSSFFAVPGTADEASLAADHAHH